MIENSQEWRNAQTSVAEFLKAHEFIIKQEHRLKSGKRIDIVAKRKITNQILHVLIEVKDWNNVSRKKESEFCQQLIEYLVEYTLEETRSYHSKVLKNTRSTFPNEKFLGVLCLTKDAHFSYRKISQHFLEKHKEFLGIPLREKLLDNMSLYVSRFDLLSKVFSESKFPLFKEMQIVDWLPKINEE
ncbi:MAG: hypothetical protein ACTSO7_11290 [Candidatus Heimdallarchaeota archaeon]